MREDTVNTIHSRNDSATSDDCVEIGNAMHSVQQIADARKEERDRILVIIRDFQPSNFNHNERSCWENGHHWYAIQIHLLRIIGELK